MSTRRASGLPPLTGNQPLTDGFKTYCDNVQKKFGTTDKSKVKGNQMTPAQSRRVEQNLTPVTGSQLELPNVNMGAAGASAGAKGSTNPKAAHGAIKAPMNTCPNTALIELNAVMAGGAHKYGAFNFRDTDIDCMTYISAIRRHFMLWEDGEDIDPESGRNHLAHIMACCALALDAHHTGKLVDNRSKTGLVPALLKDCARTHGEFVGNWKGKIA